MSVIRKAMATLLSLTVVAGAAGAAQAGERERDFARGVAAGVAGAVVVGALAQSRQRQVFYDDGYDVRPRYRYDAPVVRYQPRVVYEEPVVYRRPVRVVERRISSADAHVSWCQGRYRSYRAWDNSFQPYHGPRQQCRSPY